MKCDGLHLPCMTAQHIVWLWRGLEVGGHALLRVDQNINVHNELGLV